MKTAVVTGGGSGIGAAIARRLDADGYNVATLDLDAATGAYVADVTDRAQVDAALDQIREKFGPIAILVNSAGLDGFKQFTDITFEEWQRVVNVNLHGVFYGLRHFFANPEQPRTMTQEYQEAMTKRAKENNQNPITGISSEGYKGKGHIQAGH